MDSLIKTYRKNSYSTPENFNLLTLAVQKKLLKKTCFKFCFSVIPVDFYNSQTNFLQSTKDFM